MYDLGIIGGMGPKATVKFLEKITEYTHACTDQEHMDICVLNKASIPDRTQFLIDGENSPLQHLQRCIDDLALVGVRYVAMPCNTAHYFLDKLHVPKSMVFIDMIKETLLVAQKKYPNKPIFVLGTTGLQKQRSYGRYESSTQNEIIYPMDHQQEVLMEMIKDIKRGKDVDQMEKRLRRYIKDVKKDIENHVIILACTELSLYKSVFLEMTDVIDAMDVLAICSIKKCGYEVKKEIEDLI